MGAKRALPATLALVALVGAFGQRTAPTGKAVVQTGAAFDSSVERALQDVTAPPSSDLSPDGSVVSSTSPTPTTTPDTKWVGFAGHVTDFDGNTLSGICISAHDATADLVPRSTEVVAKTDANGFFVFE